MKTVITQPRFSVNRISLSVTESDTPALWITPETRAFSYSASEVRYGIICANNPINFVDPLGLCGGKVQVRIDPLQAAYNTFSKPGFRLPGGAHAVCYNFTAAVYSQTWFPTAPYWQNNPAFQQVAYPDLSNLPRGSLVVYSLPTPNPMNILPNPIFGQPLHSSIATGNGGLTLSVNNDPALGRGDVGWSAQAKTQYYNNPEYWYVPIQIAVFNPVGVPVAWQR